MDRKMAQNLPKNSFGVEIKITPENTPKGNEQPSSYYHPCIFKSIVIAILTAAPSTSICSIDDDNEMIIDPEDIPTSQGTIDHHLESTMYNTYTA
jgi:hypothetical protein